MAKPLAQDVVPRGLERDGGHMCVRAVATRTPVGVMPSALCVLVGKGRSGSGFGYTIWSVTLDCELHRRSAEPHAGPAR